MEDYVGENGYMVKFAGDYLDDDYDVARKKGAYCELVMVEGAGHARSRAVAGFEQYTSYIQHFLEHIGL